MQLKNQHECDLLEDIRTFVMQRARIERQYSEGLIKLSNTYLNKKIPSIPEIKLDGGGEKWWEFSFVLLGTQLFLWTIYYGVKLNCVERLVMFSGGV